MPLKGVPSRIHADFLHQLARMGHGDTLCIADANFPSDSVASECVHKVVIRAHGTTSEILRDVLQLMPLDTYDDFPLKVMDRVQSDKERDLHVPAYRNLLDVANLFAESGKDVSLAYIERMNFYCEARRCFFIIQSDDTSPYANVIVSKGVL